VSEQTFHALQQEKIPEIFLKSFFKYPKDEKSGKSKSDEEQQVLVDEIARDVDNKPYIPGSTLRGVVRNYLWQVFSGYNPAIAFERDYESDKFRKMKQKERKAEVKTFSLLEQVFGTPFSESKVEFWDAPLLKEMKDELNVPEGFSNKGWDKQRCSYVVKSVAIDPLTGAAEPNKLYNFEVVPSGAKFEVVLTGQNLADIEIGCVLFGLSGFNSTLFPLTIGAMAGRGFGRMSFAVTEICCLTNNDVKQWAELVHAGKQAGYESLDDFKIGKDKAKEFIDVFKAKIQPPTTEE
jgi:CRISPR/Cas system CSM-associated protein Csm3 (group 7 of RAMP superfamily)